MVNIRVAVAPGVESDNLTRLYNWFRDTREVSRDADITMAPGSGPGAMGTGEVINLVVGHALTLSSIAIAYASYRRALPRSPAATIQVNSGAVIVLPDDPGAALRLLRAAVADAEGSDKDTGASS